MSHNLRACPGFQAWVRHGHKAVARGGEPKGDDVAHRQTLGTRGEGGERDVPTLLMPLPSSRAGLSPESRSCAGRGWNCPLWGDASCAWTPRAWKNAYRLSIVASCACLPAPPWRPICKRSTCALRARLVSVSFGHLPFRSVQTHRGEHPAPASFAPALPSASPLPSPTSHTSAGCPALSFTDEVNSASLPNPRGQ
jgi:hypothetical protein